MPSHGTHAFCAFFQQHIVNTRMTLQKVQYLLAKMSTNEKNFEKTEKIKYLAQFLDFQRVSMLI